MQHTSANTTQAINQEQIPSRWQWRNFQQPAKFISWAMQRIGVQVNAEDQDVQMMAQGLMESDPLADAFMQWGKQQTPGTARKLLEQALEHGINKVEGAPDSLIALMRHVETDPDWLDRDLLTLGQRTLQRMGIINNHLLSSVSLMGGYYNSSVVKPLAMTGQLSKRTYGRVAETSHYAMNIMNSEKLLPGSKGFKDSLRVRVMHTMVRQRLLEMPQWHSEQDGVPINQTDMAGTGLQFSVTLIISLSVLGYRINRQEREAIIHLWRYASFLMGVEDKYNAKDFKQALRFIYIQLLSAPEADQNSRDLAQALHQVPMEAADSAWQKIKAQYEMQLRLAMTRAIMQKHVHSALDLPTSYFYPLIYLSAPIRFALESVRIMLPFLEPILRKRGKKSQVDFVQRISDGKKPDFDSAKSRAQLDQQAS